MRTITPRTVSLLSATLLALLLTACGSQPPAPEQNPSGVESRNPSVIETTPIPPVTATPGEGIDPLSMKALKDPNSPLSKRSIYFDFDSYVVKDEYQPLLVAHSKFLAAHANMKILIQGNADERGSREYNLALGQKRSDAIKKALSLLGTSESQMESVSLGEEKPTCTEATEECWGKNRRGDILYSGEF